MNAVVSDLAVDAHIDVLQLLLCSEEEVAAAASRVHARAKLPGEMEMLEAIELHAEMTSSGLAVAVGIPSARPLAPPGGLSGCLMTSLGLVRRLETASIPRPRGALHQFCRAWLEHRSTLVMRWGAASASSRASV